jgi:cytochrome P450
VNTPTPASTSSANRLFRQIPGPNGLPFIGQIFPLIYDLPNFIKSSHQKYGPVFRIRVGFEKMVIVVGPDLAREVLLDKDRLFSTELGYERLRPLFGRGLLQHDYEEHRFQRRIFQTAFTPEALSGYVGLIAKEMEEEVRTWSAVPDFRLYPNVKKLLLRTGLAVFYDIHESAENHDLLSNAFVDAIDGTLRLCDVNLPGFRMHKALKGRKVLREYLAKIIPDRRVGNGKDVFSYLCKEKKENGEYFSDEELIDHAGFLLLAAHDTNASLLHYLIFFLTQHPEWQQKIRAEIAGRSIFDFSYPELQAMEVTGWVIDEALRSHSSTPGVMRRTLRDVELSGVSVPANTNLMLMPGFNHNCPEQWRNPESFDPARFSPGRCEHMKHHYNYIPFGGGAHKCIGMHFARMQSTLFISHFLSTYDFATPKGYRVKFQYLPLPKIRDGLPLLLRRR